MTIPYGFDKEPEEESWKVQRNGCDVRFDKMDILHGNTNTNPLERELASAFEGSIINEVTESNSHLGGILP